MENPLGPAAWRKSSYSGQSGNCVEVTGGVVPGAVAVRDSKDPHGPALILTGAAWRTLARRVKNQEINLTTPRHAPRPTRRGSAAGTAREAGCPHGRAKIIALAMGTAPA